MESINFSAYELSCHTTFSRVLGRHTAIGFEACFLTAIVNEKV